MTILEQLIKDFSRLPGIGKKSAGRIVYYLLKAQPDISRNLADLLTSLHSSVKTCSVCGSYTEHDPCDICSNPNRDQSTVCVVEHSQDVQTIESTHEYNGLFHVLKGVISPLDGIGPEDLTIRQLIKRITPSDGKSEIREIIIATNPTVEGDTTALYLVKLLAKTTDITISRLASGLPVGGDIEYADSRTLSRSLQGRTKLT